MERGSKGRDVVRLPGSCEDPGSAVLHKLLLSCWRLFDIQALMSSRQLVRVLMDERKCRVVFM